MTAAEKAAGNAAENAAENYAGKIALDPAESRGTMHILPATTPFLNSASATKHFCSLLLLSRTAIHNRLAALPPSCAGSIDINQQCLPTIRWTVFFTPTSAS